MSPTYPLPALAADVIACDLCPRLRAHCVASAADPPKRFAGQTYWAKPVPGWGDAAGRLWIVGLAPAAHGGNRSGDFLFDRLRRHGFADARGRPTACYLSNAVKCAPPGNKPTAGEFLACRRWMVAEWAALAEVRVVLALGRLAWDATCRTAIDLDHLDRVPPFAHAAEIALADRTLVGCYHTSQQNTFTGRLTPQMLGRVVARCRRLTDAA